MAAQDSTFRTAHVMDNEIVKANDFEFAFEQLVENVSKATQMFLESEQDFVINGKVVPATGMNVSVSPIYGVCKSTGKPFGRTEMTDETIGFAGSSSGRIDIIEVQGDWETYDNQQRAFNDPDTDTQTYQYVDTKKLMKPVYQVKKGVEGAGVAPDVDDGWVKLAEVVINPGVTTIYEEDIKNITSDVAGLANEEWTNEEDATYNIGYISDVNARFRVQHNADGTHADKCINSDSLDIGTGAKQINGNILPVGGAVSIPTQTIAATDSILSVIIKAALMITSLYDSYLKFGTYGFNGELKISSLLDNGALKKPVSISAAGDGTAVIKIDNVAVLSIDANGKLSTNGYTASSNNHLVTKAVTDAISTALAALTTRVTNLENTSDTSVYANNTLSSGVNGRFNVAADSIYVATTANVTLSGTQVVDGITPVDGVYILVKNQTDSKTNGIYQYSSASVWSRVSTYLTPASLKAKIFNVANGITNGGKMFYMPKVNLIDAANFGSDDILFSEYFGSVKPVANKIAYRDSTGHLKSAQSSAADDCIVKGELQAIFNIIHPIGEIYVQYPQQKSPNTLYNGNGIASTWVEQSYSGAFFRASGGNASAYIDEGGSLTAQGDTTKSHTHNMEHVHITNIDHTHEINDPGHRHAQLFTGHNYGISGFTPSPSGGGDYVNISGGAPYYGALEIQANVTGITVKGLGPYGVSSGGPLSGGIAITDTGSNDIYANETRPTNFTIKIWKRTA